MSQFYETMKDLICREMAKKAAATVDEKPGNVEKAVSAIMPSLLAMYLKTRNPNVNNILREAGNLDIIKNIDNICNETPNESQRRIGDDFLQTMLGDKAADFTAPVAQEAGISKVAANRLISMIAPVVAGYLGEKLVKDRMSETQLQDTIRRSKSSFVKDIPAGIVKAFDLSYIIRTDTPETAIVEKKKSHAWIWWLLLLAALLLLFFGWRSCKQKEDKVEEVITTTTVVESKPEVTVGDFFDITLPNGIMLNVFRNGVEDQMIHFLNSDEYKNATNDQLKGKWFEFKDVVFKFDSTTELEPGSDLELSNIAAILKAFPAAKIQIAAFTDKKGSEALNLEISKARAMTIEKILRGKGVESQIVKAEGFGERGATHSVTETDTQRGEDRDIALRFVK